MLILQKKNHGLQFLETDGLAETKFYVVQLDETDTKNLLQKIKELAARQPDKPKSQEKYVDSEESDVEEDSHPQRKITITHLGHAAMVLAMLRSNPLPRSSAQGQPVPLYSPCWFNGRKYITGAQGVASGPLPPPLLLGLNFKGVAVTQPSVQAVQRDPSANYTPLCLSFAPIKFPDLKELSLSSEADDEEIMPLLVKACWIASKQYAKIGKGKNMLTTCVELFEDLGKEKRYDL